MTTPKHTTQRALAVLAAAGAALAVAASPASADSIAYVKSGNIHLSTSDGSRQYQVTFDGGYSAVSQADSGRIVGLKGTHLRTLERDGTLVADITTPVSDPSDTSKQFYGPYDPAISPDGQKVAYDYIWKYNGYDPYCNPSNGCYLEKLYQGTGFTSPLRLTGWEEEGFKRQSGWVDPSWTGTDNEVMISNPSEPLNEDVVLYSPGITGSGGGFIRWFSDTSADLSDGEMTRDETKIAFVGDGGKHISIWRGLGGYPATPFGCYALNDPKGAFSSPSWSHDGGRLAWAEDDGVHVIALPDLRDGCGLPSESTGRLVIPGASNPDWGPADVPPARPAPAPSPGPGGPGAEKAASKKASSKKAKLKVTAPKLRRALSKGLKVTVTGARKGKHRLTLRHGRKLVGSGTVKISSKGTGTTTIRFSKSGKRALRTRASAKLTLSGAGTKATVMLRR